MAIYPFKRGITPFRKFHQFSFFEKPLPCETRIDFKERVHKNIVKSLGDSVYANHLLFMSYSTRIARVNETLKNTSKQFGLKTMAALDLCIVEKKILPGHCLLAFIDAKGTIAHDHTFSLRPNMKKQSFYKASTAPDQRLPSNIINEGTYVRPALHTTLLQEIDSWSNDAFYAWYVHPERQNYPLHFILKPLDLEGQHKYFKAVKDLKSVCQSYSLLDHFHKYTGETLGDIVCSQNCTTLFRLLETINPSSELKKILGDNPTTQLVRKMVNEYFQYETKDNKKSENIIEVGDDELSKPFRRVYE